MTYSAPKMSDKVERHGSPNNNSGKRPNNKSASIKTATYFSSTASAGKNNNSNHSPNRNINIINDNNNNNMNNNSTKNANGRTSCSPQCNNTRNTRMSPSKSMDSQSPRGSPTSSFYAGAKFSEPPSPASLPKPPRHWTTRLIERCTQSETCCNISNHVKMILNVQA